MDDISPDDRAKIILLLGVVGVAVIIVAAIMALLLGGAASSSMSRLQSQPIIMAGPPGEGHIATSADGIVERVPIEYTTTRTNIISPGTALGQMRNGQV
jgi:hypothetical protein